MLPPTAAGNATGSLTVPSDAASGTLMVALTGAGQTPAAPAPPATAPTLTVPNAPTGGLTVQEGSATPPTGLTVQMSAAGTLTVTGRAGRQRQVGGGGHRDRFRHSRPARFTSHSAPSVSGHTLIRRARVVLPSSADDGNGTPGLDAADRQAAGERPARPASPTVGDGQPAQHHLAARAQRTDAVADVPAQPLGDTADDLAGADARPVAAGRGCDHACARRLDRVQLVGRWQGRLVPARVLRLTVTARSGRAAVGNPDVLRGRPSRRRLGAGHVPRRPERAVAGRPREFGLIGPPQATG